MLYAVALAGGSGTRFWPLSRERYPKQLLRILGEETMIQRTVRLAGELVPLARVFVVTHEQHAEAIQIQLSALDRQFPERIIQEPVARNTAAAIALAAIHLQRLDPDAAMLVLPADHSIRDHAAFGAAVKRAAQVAAAGYLVTLGIEPTGPETGYGYIRRGGALRAAEIKGLGAYSVARFIEKPNLVRAKTYVKDKHYLWNSGIFLWRTQPFLEAVRRHLPELASGLDEIQRALGSHVQQKAIRQAYSRVPSISVDYGVLEHAERLAVIPVSMGWSDVGSWAALAGVSDLDEHGNVVSGNVVDLGSEDSVLYAEKRLVATIGLKKMVVVDTPDATLVCPKDRVQEVRQMVALLKERGAEESLVHRTVFRPWGSFTVLETGDGYKIKRIEVNPGARLSLQMHHKRSEHWVVVAGRARVTCGDKVYELLTHQSTYIPQETRHRLENPGPEPLQIIEVQNGSYVGEDDIVRFDDDYGRSGKRPSGKS